MLSKSTIKYINSLRIKKYRNEKGLFIAEGARLIDDLLNSSLEVVELYHIPEWKINRPIYSISEIKVSEDDMKKISGLDSSTPVLAVVKIPDIQLSTNLLEGGLSLAMDDIQDPGNMGTIIRLADWFGIDFIICSNGTVDVFSPKVVQASMGAISRVKVIYCDLQKTLSEYNKLIPIYGTFMGGSNIYNEKLVSKAIVVMGNEGNGISPDIEKHITDRIHIPCFATNRSTVESLNVAVATSIVCSEFRRRKYIL